MEKGYKQLVVGLLIIFCGFIASGHPSEPIKILTVGNSFSRNAVQYLSEITNSVKGCEIEVTKGIISGCSLEEHIAFIHESEKDATVKPYNKESSLKELLLMDSYDYVTIQQVSLLSFKPESFQPYADELVDYIEKYAPGAKVIVHQTWAYHPESARLAKWKMSQDDMYQGLKNNYETLANRYDTFILPTGDAFDTAFKKNPSIGLWAKDHHHANINGQYLAGCIWFATLFDISPMKIKYFPEEMGEKTAKHLKKAANSVYKNLEK